MNLDRILLFLFTTILCIINILTVFKKNGIRGPEGLQGLVGPTGAVGLPVKGPKGPAGPQGPSGPPGSNGVMLQGSRGFRGPAGSPGLIDIPLTTDISLVPYSLAFVGGSQESYGSSGPSGPFGPPGTPAYSQTALYSVGDMVSYAGLIYSLIGNTFTPPPNDNLFNSTEIIQSSVNGPGFQYVLNQIGISFQESLQIVFFKCIVPYSFDPVAYLYFPFPEPASPPPSGNTNWEPISGVLLIADIQLWTRGQVYVPNTFLRNLNQFYVSKASSPSRQPTPTDSPVWNLIGYEPSFVSDPLAVLKGPIVFESFDTYDAIIGPSGPNAFYGLSADLKLQECYQMATNGSALVAVGSSLQNEYVWYSLDFGETWEVCTVANRQDDTETEFTNPIRTVASIGSVFVCAGDGAFYSSYNGIQWEQLTVPPVNIISIGAHNSFFFAFADQQIYQSTRIIQPSVQMSQAYIRSQPQFQISFRLVYTLEPIFRIVPNIHCFIIDSIRNPCILWRRINAGFGTYSEANSLGVLVNESIGTSLRGRMLRSQNLLDPDSPLILDRGETNRFDTPAISVFWNYRNIYYITEEGLGSADGDGAYLPIISGPFVGPRALWNGTYFFVWTPTRLIRFQTTEGDMPLQVTTFQETTNSVNQSIISNLWCPIMSEPQSFAQTISNILSG